MRFRGVLGALSRAMNDPLCGRFAKSCTVEYPWTIRQGMNCIDLADFGGLSERFWRDAE